MDVSKIRAWPSLALSRSTQLELLDLGQGEGQDVAANLAEMQRINDWLGGTRALTRHLYPRLQQHQGRARLLDLGTGGAGLPLHILTWAEQRGLPLEFVAVDWSARNLHAADQALKNCQAITRLQADALALPLPPGNVDYVISSLFLHHLNPDEVVQLLQQAYRLARRAVIMSDLVRGRLPYFAFRLIQPLFARNYLTRHDGALSVRRAYTPAELLALADRTGLPATRVYSHFPWRMTLVIEK